MTKHKHIVEDVLLKHRVIQTARKVMEAEAFVEVNTPAIRAATSKTAPRRRVLVEDVYRSTNDAFLKHSHDAALRTMLRYCQRVFELNLCFRLDAPDDSHYPEFMLLELAASGEQFEFFIKMAQQIISAVFETEITYKMVSVREFMLKDLRIDIAKVDDHTLKARLLNASLEEYAQFRDLPAFHVVNRYIADKIEPGTGFYFLVDYPLCTISKAKRVEGTNIIHRFEAFINGLEVANSYLYEDNVEDYIKRSKANEHYNSEVEATAKLLQSRELPQLSGILGIGIERLCCAFANRGIHNFVFAKEFGFIAPSIYGQNTKENRA